ncbi:unnamed protein product, partial [marine sediment metagenome]
ATLAVIFGNRDFFPDNLVTEARKDIQAVFQEYDIRPVMVGESDSKLSSIETYENAKICANLFKAHRDDIDGILVVLPNFGDEKAVADTIKLSGLQVPILVQAYPDELNAFGRAPIAPKRALRNPFTTWQTPINFFKSALKLSPIG